MCIISSSLVKEFPLAREIGDVLGNIVVGPLTFEVSPASLVAVVGPSGCGKTTLLKLIANIYSPTSGTIIIPESVSERIGYQPQRDAYLPWATLAENVKAAMKMTLPRSSINFNETERLLSIVELLSFKNQFPSALSGGMKQRLALARTLAIQPTLFLVDEPFNQLDMSARRSMMTILCQEVKRKNATLFFVTHSLDEAIEFSTDIICLRKDSSEKTTHITNTSDSSTLIREKLDLALNVEI